MALYNLDYPILPGGAARTLMIDSDGTLPYVDDTGTEPIAEAETVNAGKLLCAVGTMVWNASFSVIAQLGPDGWEAVTGDLPDVDDPPEEETPDAPEDPGEGGDDTPGSDTPGDGEGGDDSEGGEDATEEENNG